ncbi:MAG: hypothetical protein ACJ75F_13505, partial [Flavisolibacter sp.]
MAIFLSACKRNYVTLDYTNAKGEVPQLGNLIFRFNKSLYPDSLINSWDSSEYISFKPDIPGRFRWNGPDELVFSPSQPLRPATSYEAKLNNEILHFSKYNDIKDADKIKFQTQPLELSDAQVSWVLQDEGHRTAVPQIIMLFNYPVRTEDLKDKLHIEVEGNKSEYTILNAGVTSKVSVRLDGFKSEDRNYEAQLLIDKGLKPEKGTNAIADAIQASLNIPSPFVLNINHVESEHDGTQGII